MAPRLLSSPDIAADKARLRAEGLARRDALSPDARAAGSSAIGTTLLALPMLSDADPVAAFWPLGSEVDLRPVLHALHEAGRTLALPVVARPTLLFRRWRPGDPLARRPFGVQEPLEGAPLVRPALLLVPLARFDGAGNRLGYGRGHYDRAIAALHPVRTIGVAFAVQHCEAVPAEAHDRPLDMIVTERAVWRASRP